MDSRNFVVDSMSAALVSFSNDVQNSFVGETAFIHVTEAMACATPIHEHLQANIVILSVVHETTPSSTSTFLSYYIYVIFNIFNPRLSCKKTVTVT